MHAENKALRDASPPDAAQQQQQQQVSPAGTPGQVRSG